MKIKSENNFSKIRTDQINELYRWGIENTNLEKLLITDLIKFFFTDKESIAADLLYVSQIFHELVNYGKKTFKIGDYIASEYATTVILRKTKGLDVAMIHKEIIQNGTIIHPSLSNSAKIKIIQKIISQMNKEEIDTFEKEIIEKLIKKEGLSETDAKSCIEKALQLGAITKTKSGKLSL